MRVIRASIVAAILVVVMLAAVPQAHASKCTQYPYFIQPILCRL